MFERQNIMFFYIKGISIDTNLIFSSIMILIKGKLVEASDPSIAAHFLLIMRTLLRTLNGGTGHISAAWVIITKYTYIYIRY